MARTTDPIETEFQGPQLLGDIANSRSGAITVSGSLDDLTPDVLLLELLLNLDHPPFVLDSATGQFIIPDIDWYQFELFTPAALTFDIDFANNFGAGTSSSLCESLGPNSLTTMARMRSLLCSH